MSPGWCSKCKRIHKAWAYGGKKPKYPGPPQQQPGWCSKCKRIHKAWA